MRKLLALLFVGAVGILLLYVVASMPPMGDGQSPANSHLAPYYRDAGLSDTGSHNLVTGVTINYRGYDALAKVTVIFTALAALLAILGRERKGSRLRASRYVADSPQSGHPYRGEAGYPLHPALLHLHHLVR